MGLGGNGFRLETSTSHLAGRLPHPPAQAGIPGKCYQGLRNLFWLIGLDQDPTHPMLNQIRHSPDRGGYHRLSSGHGLFHDHGRGFQFGGEQPEAVIREAKRICLGCEVKDACLDYALAHDERFGIWGGLSERERRRLKRGII